MPSPARAQWNARGELFVLVQFVLLELIFGLPGFLAFAFPALLGSTLKYLGFALLIWAGISLGCMGSPRACSPECATRFAQICC
jgi:hypothetical protein